MALAKVSTCGSHPVRPAPARLPARPGQLQVATCASFSLHYKDPANAHEGSSDVKIRQLSNKAADSVKFRAMVGASACAVASALVLAGGVTSAQAETRCTWGGTPANPTGTIAFDPGLTLI